MPLWQAGNEAWPALWFRLLSRDTATGVQAPGLFSSAGEGVTQCILEDQPGWQFRFLRVLLEELHKHFGQLPAIHRIRNAQVTVDFVDLFFAVMKRVIGLGAEMAGYETID